MMVADSLVVQQLIVTTIDLELQVSHVQFTPSKLDQIKQERILF